MPWFDDRCLTAFDINQTSYHCWATCRTEFNHNQFLQAQRERGQTHLRCIADRQHKNRSREILKIPRMPSTGCPPWRVLPLFRALLHHFWLVRVGDLLFTLHDRQNCWCRILTVGNGVTMGLCLLLVLYNPPSQRLRLDLLKCYYLLSDLDAYGRYDPCNCFTIISPAGQVMLLLLNCLLWSGSCWRHIVSQ